MALGCEVVDLVGAHLAHDLDDAHGVAEVGVVEVEVGLALQMRDALTEINTAAADDAVHFVAFFQKKLAQVRAILTGDTGD